MKKLFVLISFAILSMSLVGCGAMIKRDQVKKFLEEGYFKAMLAEDYDKAFSYYGPAFFEKTDKNRWKRKIKDFKDTMGALTSFENLDWKMYKTADESKKFVALHYQVVYEHGKTKESIHVIYDDKAMTIAKHTKRRS